MFLTKGWFPLLCNFSVSMCVKFTFANKIEAMYEGKVTHKRKSRTSSNFMFDLSTLYLVSILFMWLKFSALTCVAKEASVEINLKIKFLIIPSMSFFLKIFNFLWNFANHQGFCWDVIIKGICGEPHLWCQNMTSNREKKNLKSSQV